MKLFRATAVAISMAVGAAGVGWGWNANQQARDVQVKYDQMIKCQSGIGQDEIFTWKVVDGTCYYLVEGTSFWFKAPTN